MEGAIRRNVEPEDIQEALNYAAFLADEQVVEFAS